MKMANGERDELGEMVIVTGPSVFKAYRRKRKFARESFGGDWVYNFR